MSTEIGTLPPQNHDYSNGHEHTVKPEEWVEPVEEVKWTPHKPEPKITPLTLVVQNIRDPLFITALCMFVLALILNLTALGVAISGYDVTAIALAFFSLSSCSLSLTIFYLYMVQSSNGKART